MDFVAAGIADTKTAAASLVVVGIAAADMAILDTVAAMVFASSVAACTSVAPCRSEGRESGRSLSRFRA